MIDQMQQKTYCPYAFKGLAIEPNNDIKPCCRYDATNDQKIPNTSSLEQPVQALNSVLFKDVRQKMRQGQEVPGCWKCTKEEQAIGKSMRTNAITQFNDYGNLPQDIQLEFLELMVGRQCNLKCRTCSPYLSTSWDEDLKKSDGVKTLFFGASHEHFDDMTKRPITNESILSFSHETCKKLKDIKITGGEPFLQDDLIIFLDRLVEWDLAKHIRLEIFTNCSFYPKPKYRSMFKSFKEVKIKLSLDAIGTKSDYIRKKSIWDKTVKVAEFWKQYAQENNNVQIGISHTVSIFNILYYDEYIDWIIDMFSDTFTIDVNPIHYPTYLTAYNFPNDVKQKIQTELHKQQESLKNKFDSRLYRKYIGKYMFKLIDYLETDSNKNEPTFAGRDIINQFKATTESLDKVRNDNSWQLVFPKLSEIIND